MTAALVLVVALSGTFAHAVTISTIARLLSMTSTCLSLPVLRLKASEPPARFVVPGGWFVSMAAIALCGWLLVTSPWRDVSAVLIAAAAGLVIYYGTSRWRQQTPTRF
jgi:amino acid transporter